LIVGKEFIQYLREPGDKVVSDQSKQNCEEHIDPRGERLENNGRSWNLGDILHLVQIAVLLISIGIAYEKFDIFTSQVSVHTQQLNRIEHYLSSKDSEYWNHSEHDE
jgi:hypothetical protein